jgi:hypothetical protein
MKTRILLLCVVLSLHLYAGAQCTVPAPAATPACGAPGETLLASNTAIYSGTYYYNGTGTLTNVTNYGATIIVCGNLTVTNTILGSGNLFIASGGSLTFSDAVGNALQMNTYNYGTFVIQGSSNYQIINVNASVWNYGTFNANASLTMNSGGLYNALSTSSMTVAGDLVDYVPTVNNGNMKVNGEFTFTSTICMGGGSDIATDSLYADGPANSVTVTSSPTSGNAGFTVSNYFNSNSNSLTTSSHVVMCEATGIVGPTGNPGSATVKPNCTNIVLPVTLVSFTAHTGLENTCTLEWTTAMEDALKDYTIEYSLDGRTYTSLAVVEAHHEASTYTYQTFLQGKTWFRLRIDNEDGTYSYSQVVEADFAGATSGASYTVLVQPNLVTGNTLNVWSNMATAQSGEWIVVDMTGRIIVHEPVRLGAGSSNTSLLLPNMASGVYRLLFEGSQVKPKPVAFSVVH